jgi:hypothetical protein
MSPPLLETRCHFRTLFVLMVRWVALARNFDCLNCLLQFRLSFRHSLVFRTLSFLPPFSWAHRSGNSCPLRLRVFCFLGSALTQPGPSQNADASLRLEPPRS